MSSIQSHPTTSTGGPVPQPASNTLSSSAAQSTSTGSDTASSITDPNLPEQRHAGKVGYGPNYRAGASLEDRVLGLKEEIKGKLTHNPDRVQHGREIYSGEEKRKKLTGEDEPNPFENADEDDSTDPAKVAEKQNQDPNQDPTQANDPSSTTSNPAAAQSTTSANKSASNTSSSQSPIKTETETQRPGNPGNTSRDPDVTFQPTAKANPAGMAVDQGHGPGAKEQAATVAPEGTKEAEVQRRGGAEDGVKHIDARN